MTLQSVEYAVAELPEYPQQLAVAGGAARYVSHSNASQPESLGIGVFERPLASGELASLESRLNPEALRMAPDHRGQVLSGDRSRRIRLATADGMIEKLVGTRLPIDPAIERAIDVLDMLVSDVTQHPQRVLRMNVHDTALRRDGEFSATLTLIGSGDQPVRFLPQPDRGGVRDEVFTLYWWPYVAGAPRGDVQSASVSTEAVAPSAPAAVATVRVRSRLDGMPAGPVAVQIRFSNLDAERSGRDLPIGELFSGPVVVD